MCSGGLLAFYLDGHANHEFELCQGKVDREEEGRRSVGHGGEGEKEFLDEIRRGHMVWVEGVLSGQCMLKTV